MKKSNGKALYASLHYFEPIHKYQNLSFTDIKDLTKENKIFPDFYLINKNNHKILLKDEIIGFIYQNTKFKTFQIEIFYTIHLIFFQNYITSPMKMKTISKKFSKLRIQKQLTKLRHLKIKFRK